MDVLTHTSQRLSIAPGVLGFFRRRLRGLAVLLAQLAGPQLSATMRQSCTDVKTEAEARQATAGELPRDSGAASPGSSSIDSDGPMLEGLKYCATIYIYDSYDSK